jgi:vancomycin resistance protein YoaR
MPMKIGRTSTRRTGGGHGGSYGIRTRSSAGYPREAQAGYRREAEQVSYKRESQADGYERKTAKRQPGRRSKSPKRLLFIGATCVVALVVAGVAIASRPKAVGPVSPVSTADLEDPDKITQGVRINGKDVSGQNVNELSRNLSAEMQSKVDEIAVTVTYGEQSWEISGKDLGAANNADEVLGQVALLAHVGTPEQKAEEARQIEEEGRDFTVETTFDESALTLALDGIAKTINQRGSDAIPIFNYLKGKFADLEHPKEEEIVKMFSISPEKPGISVDVDTTAQRILGAIKDNPKCSVELAVTPFVPTLTADMLEESFQLFSHCSTRVSRAKTNTADRIKNIERALSKINGVTILPGHEFSFNDTVGPRTEANGFALARTISGGKYVDDFGGGTCQVSTTLYIAALRTGVKITERYRHTYPSGYAVNGLDATVAYGSKDLKFINTSDRPIYIYAKYTGETGYSSTSRYIHVIILGKPLPNGQYYDLISEDLFKGDIPEMDVQIAKNGEWGLVYSDEEYVEMPSHRRYDVATYRQLYQDDGDGVEDPNDGETTRVGATYDTPIGDREELYVDYYQENKGIKWIGAKERPAGYVPPTEPPE